MAVLEGVDFLGVGWLGFGTVDFETLAIHYVQVDEKVIGPYSLKELNELRQAGKIPENAYYSVKGIEGWHPISELFKPTIVKPPPPLGAQKRHRGDFTKPKEPHRSDEMLGLLLIFVGQVIAIYFFAYFDPSTIQLAPGRVDMGLYFHQQNGMLLGISVMLLGGMLYVAGRADRKLGL